MRPGRHGASELHARPTQPEPRARLTSVLGAADVPVTAGFQAAARSVRFRPDVTTPPPRPAPPRAAPALANEFLPVSEVGVEACRRRRAAGGGSGGPFRHRVIRCLPRRVGFRLAATPVCEVTPDRVASEF